MAADVSRRYVQLVVTSLSLIAMVCIMLLLPVPYVTMRPGPAFDTLGAFDGKPMITFGKHVRTYPDRGKIDFTTVSVTRAEARVTLLEAMASYFAPDTAVIPRRLIYADNESATQARRKSQRQLLSSKDYSRAAGLRAAGYTVGEEAIVAAVGTKVPASGHLRTGDVIVAIGGRPTRGAFEAMAAMAKRTPGDRVTMTIRRRGIERSVTMKTVADPLDPTLARVGIALGSRFDYPIAISNHVGSRIGGPSAGTMFALAIYDRLTPGSLTGGLHVAGTGAIRPDGVVVPIGGVRQKIAGAAHNGATVFLVPSKNCADAIRDADSRGRSHGMRLVRVRTLDDAIASLKTLAATAGAGGKRSGPGTVPGCGTPH